MAGESNLLMDFLSFRVLLTPSILVLIYYAGAIALPLAGWWTYLKLRGSAGGLAIQSKGHLRDAAEASEAARRWKKRLIVLAVLIFIMMELGWRILIEFFIAYFQMHNALMNLSVGG